jgi:iron complex outermembrane receptor protein
LDYRRRLGRGEFTIRTDTNYRDSYNSDTSGSKYTVIDGFSVTNLSVGYRFARSWEVEAFARNVFDEEYVTALTIQTGNSGLILGQAGEPRTLGVAFRFSKN